MDRHKRYLIAAFLFYFPFTAKLPLAAESQTPLRVEAMTQLRSLSEAGQRPKIAIIIDDLGHTWGAGARAIHLPGPVAYSILPYTRFSTRLATLARKYGKEVLLHMPMEPEDHRHPESPGTLRHDMSRDQFMLTLRAGLEAVPHVIGINNHMGSLLTQQPLAMTWLMEELQRDGRLFFVDSRTTPASVATRLARSHGLAHLPRNVFLDHDRDPNTIERQFDLLKAQAKRTGFALAIGHPYPETLEILERRLGALDGEVDLVPVSSQVRPAKPRVAAAASAGIDDPQASSSAPVFTRGHTHNFPTP